MTPHVLVLGGAGMIGRSVAKELMLLSSVKVTITSRKINRAKKIAESLNGGIRPVQLDLSDLSKLEELISECDLVIDCAGPFNIRDNEVATMCINRGKDYVDVSDNRDFADNLIKLRSSASNEKVRLITGSGVFPGLSNSLVKSVAESMDSVDGIRMYYVVAGSGGAGKGALMTNFLTLGNSFKAWINEQWHRVEPLSQCEKVVFLSPYLTSYPCWLELPETSTFVDSFSPRTVTTKFCSHPKFYHNFTRLTASIMPSTLLSKPAVARSLSEIALFMTSITDRFSGIGVGINAHVSGTKGGNRVSTLASLYHSDTAMLAGYGSALIASKLIESRTIMHGVWPVEQFLSTKDFYIALRHKNIALQVWPHT